MSWLYYSIMGVLCFLASLWWAGRGDFAPALLGFALTGVNLVRAWYAAEES
jgi:hypothetical protein